MSGVQTRTKLETINHTGIQVRGGRRDEDVLGVEHGAGYLRIHEKSTVELHHHVVSSSHFQWGAVRV